MKVVVDKDKCIGAAPCIAVAPDVYELDDEGKAFVKEDAKESTDGDGKIKIKTAVADDETIKTSAESCPVQAIILYDDDGNQIFPAAA
jgi:ferredoxin